MPQVRKISAAEFAVAELASALPADVRLLDVLRITPGERPLIDAPRIGDVVRLAAPRSDVIGVVLEVQPRRGDAWASAELLTPDGVQWSSRSEIECILGRPKGVSRIDQPTKQLAGRVHGGSHGWFARIYEGKQHKIARLFSDARYGARAAALLAALAFLAEATADKD
jgi:hypothetical protein